MSFLYNPNPTPIFNNSGQFASGAKAYFYVGGTTTPLVVYQDSELSAQHPIPVVADIVGKFPPIFIPYGSYSIKIADADGAVLYYPNGSIDNPAPPSSGGGISVNSTQIIQTGDPIWRLRSGQMSGFVRMNGRTLGSLSSAATEYAADDASALFQYLWTNLPDSIATVSTGRGASALADFQANKTIIIPTMQGYLSAGVDDMGTTAANVLQFSTTCTATNGSPTLTVGSATGIGRTMYAIIDGVAAGQVTAISGTTITLDTNYAGVTGSGKAVRFSYFPDAQQVGMAGGSDTASQTSAEVGGHTHTITDPGHTHNVANVVSGAAGGQFSVGGALNQTSVTSASATTGVTVNSGGSGLPSSIIQPTRIGTFYMKL